MKFEDFSQRPGVPAGVFAGPQSGAAGITAQRLFRATLFPLVALALAATTVAGPRAEDAPAAPAAAVPRSELE